MPHIARLQLSGSDSAQQVVAAEFTDEEWASVESFATCADDLFRIGLIQRGAQAKLDLHYEQGKGMKCTVQLPPEDDVLVLLHRLRPFLLESEPTNFNRVCEMLARRLDHAGVRSFMKTLRGFGGGVQQRSLMTISSNGVLLNGDDLLMKWLNAHEYHRDRDKQAELESLHKVFPFEGTRAIFIMMLYDKVKAIDVLYGIVEVLLGRRQELTCKIPGLPPKR